MPCTVDLVIDHVLVPDSRIFGSFTTTSKIISHRNFGMQLQVRLISTIARNMEMVYLWLSMMTVLGSEKRKYIPTMIPMKMPHCIKALLPRAPAIKIPCVHEQLPQLESPMLTENVVAFT